MSTGSRKTAHQWKRCHWIHVRSITPTKQKTTRNDLTNKEEQYFRNLLTTNHSGDTLLIAVTNTQILTKCRQGGKISTFHTT